MTSTNSRTVQQLESLDFHRLLAEEAVRRHSDDINGCIEFCTSPEGEAWLRRQLRLEKQKQAEKELHDEMASITLLKLKQLGKYPEKWCAAAVNITDPTPRRCMEWIEGHRSTLEQALPTADTLQQQRRRLASASVRLGSRPGLRRTQSEEYGYSRSIVKNDDIRKNHGKVRYRPSVSGRDLTPLKLAAGYLRKKGKTGSYTWRYCVLNNEYFNYYKNSSAFELRKPPMGSYSLLTVAHVELNDRQVVLHFKQGAILSYKKRFMRKKFKAKDSVTAEEWVAALRMRISWFQGLRNAEESSIALRELIKYSMPITTNFKIPVHQLGPDVIVDGPIIYKNKDGWDNGTVFLGPVVPMGARNAETESPVHEWTFRVQVGTAVTVGVASLFADVNSLLNRSRAGWGVYLNNGNKGHGGMAKTGYAVPALQQGHYNPRATNQGPPWRGGAKVTVRFDAAAGTFGVAINDEWQGVAYQRLHQQAAAIVCGVSLCKKGDCISLESFPPPMLQDLGLDYSATERAQHAAYVDGATNTDGTGQSATRTRRQPARPTRFQRPVPPVFESSSESSPESNSEIDSQSDASEDAHAPAPPPRHRQQPVPPTTRPPRRASRAEVGAAAASVFARVLEPGHEAEVEDDLAAVMAAAANKSPPPPPPPLPANLNNPLVNAVHTVTPESGINVYDDPDLEAPAGHLIHNRQVLVAGCQQNRSGESVARITAVLKDGRTIPAQGFVKLSCLAISRGLNSPTIAASRERTPVSFRSAAAAVALSTPKRRSAQSSPVPTIASMLNARSNEKRRYVSPQIAQLSTAKQAARASAARRLSSSVGTHPNSPQLSATQQAIAAAEAEASASSPAPPKASGGHLLMLRQKETPRADGDEDGHVNIDSDDASSGGSRGRQDSLGGSDDDNTFYNGRGRTSGGGAKSDPSKPDDLESSLSTSIFAAQDQKDLSQYAQGTAPEEWDRLRRVRGLVRTSSGRYVKPADDTSEDKQGSGHVFWDQIHRNRRRQQRREMRAMHRALHGKVNKTL